MRGIPARVTGMVARCVVALADSARMLQSLQLRVTAGDVKDSVEHFEPYGYTSCPQPGAEGVVAFLGGDRSHGVALVIGDRRYRLQGLKPGEVALYTDEGDQLVFKRGRIVELTTKTFIVNAEEKVQFNTPLVEASAQARVNGLLTGAGGAALSGGAGGVGLSVTGTASVSGDLTAAGKSVAHHRHPETGSTTGEPQ